LVGGAPGINLMKASGTNASPSGVSSDVEITEDGI